MFSAKCHFCSWVFVDFASKFCSLTHKVSDDLLRKEAASLILLLIIFYISTYIHTYPHIDMTL